MEGFNSQQGTSNRDVEVNKEEVVAAKAVMVENAVYAYILHTRQEAFPNMSPRWEAHNKVICQALTAVALPLGLQVDRPPADLDTNTQCIQTTTKYSTTGTCVIPAVLMSRMVTIWQCAGKGRWTTRRAPHAIMHRHTLP